MECPDSLPPSQLLPANFTTLDSPVDLSWLRGKAQYGDALTPVARCGGRPLCWKTNAQDCASMTKPGTRLAPGLTLEVTENTLSFRYSVVFYLCVSVCIYVCVCVMVYEKRERKREDKRRTHMTSLSHVEDRNFPTHR
jgi:hypothetical protein